jgi:maleamate amidohydrolase
VHSNVTLYQMSNRPGNTNFADDSSRNMARPSREVATGPGLSGEGRLVDDAGLLTTYRQAELGGRVGLGSRPAILVVDFQNCFVDPSIPGGFDFSDAIEHTRSLLDFARSNHIRIVFSRVAYRPDLSDAGLFITKCPSLRFARLGTTNVDIDPRLGPRPEEIVVTKQFASAFHGTPLCAMLSADRVDTLIVCGCTTSGCVRATVVDALQHGFRALIPRECVADLDPAPHEANLFDMDAKYGDVVNVADLLEDLTRLTI